jgi:DNA primase
MAGKITQSFIDELMNRVDVVEVIDSRVPLKKAGREYTACCPFHNEKTPSFTVSQNKQFYHCFGCGAHGTAVGFLMEYEHMSFPEAVEELAQNVGIEIQYETNASYGSSKPKEKKQDDSLYALMAKCDQYYRQQLRQHPQAKQAIEYLKQRGLSGEIAAEFGLGYAPPGWDNLQSKVGDSAEQIEKLVSCGMLIQKDDKKTYDRFRERIMFPIRDRRGRTIGFGGRILPGGQESKQERGGKLPAKYLNSPETPLFHKGQELYGLYETRQALRDISRLLVVEGYMDVVALSQFGIRYAVATLGTATTEEHLHKLFRLTKEVVFCFDGDRAGRDAAWRALNNALPVMREGRQIRFMFLPDGEDPDSFVRAKGKEGFESEITNSLTFSDFFFSWLGKQADTNSIDGRAQLVALARPLITKLPPGIFSHMMRNQLAQLSRIESSELEHLLITATAKTSGSNSEIHTPTTVDYQSKPFIKRNNINKQPLTPVRTALMRVLYQPILAQEAGNPERFSGLSIPGIELLMKIIETLQSHPHLNSSAILERWRESEHGPHLEKLVAWTPELDDSEALKMEFLGALARLDHLSIEQRYDFLLIRSNQGELSPDEKSELKELFVHINRDKLHDIEQKDK